MLKVHSMLCGIGTTEFFAHSHKPVRTKDDLKGLKHRTLGVWASVLNEKLGGAAVTISGEELFGALERKTIDSLEWAGPGGNIGMGFHKVARYIIVPGAHQPASPVECVVNLDKWNTLSETDKALMEQAAMLTTFSSYLATGQEDQKAMPQYRQQGNEFVEMDAKLVKEIQDETRAWLDAKAKENDAKGNPWAARLLKSITEYQETWASNSTTRAWERK
ncbi:MAG: C4-dicarboxylate ABC transporter substrate-binding protein [Alphaproteobacteria bacterium]|nr:C4-dicarboxylate ABC transporter substrate-binding protein [Alphaproteobacteria bacterium]